MIDLKINKNKAEAADERGERDERQEVSETPAGSENIDPRTAQIRRRGLSPSETIGAGPMQSVGGRGVDTTGVESGAGAGAGLTMNTPAAPGESPAPQVTPPSRTTGMTPRGQTMSTPAGQPYGGNSTGKEEPGHDDIARLAHQFWQDRGSSAGTPEDDWFRAEQELRKQNK